MKAKVGVCFFLLIIVPYCTRNPIDPVDYSDGEYILFIRTAYRSSEPFSEICTIRPDGSDLRVIARQNDISNRFVRGRWSPDKSFIAVEGGPRESREWNPLWLMDMRGTLLKRLAWAGRKPVWTSDGESVIYYRRRGYFAFINDIYKVNIHELKEDTLIIAENNSETLSFYMYHILDLFPNDNTKLLMNEWYVYTDTSGKQNNDDSEIVIYDYARNKKVYLIDNDIEEGKARISLDGSFIAYSIYNPGIDYSKDHLYLMTADGDSIRRLTFGTDTDLYSSFAWSPDGNSLVYSKANRSDEGHNIYDDIFTLEINMTAEKRLTNTVHDSISYYIMDWK